MPPYTEPPTLYAIAFCTHSYHRPSVWALRLATAEVWESRPNGSVPCFTASSPSPSLSGYTMGLQVGTSRALTAEGRPHDPVLDVCPQRQLSVETVECPLTAQPRPATALARCTMVEQPRGRVFWLSAGWLAGFCWSDMVGHAQDVPRCVPCDLS